MTASDSVDDTPTQPPIIIAGMHRSGTSLVASFVEALGVALGERQLAPDANNPRGYFEDVDFVELHGRMLLAATRPEDGGHRDWGWTESEQLTEDRFQAFADEARALLASRAESGAAMWGWKDPRTTVTLRFWDALVPTARWILVYRFPWEVADSMQRAASEVWLRQPGYAYRIWAFYNRRILEFFARRRDRAVLVSANALVGDPGALAVLLHRRLRLAVRDSDVAGRLDPNLFRRSQLDDPLVPLALAAHPECAALLRDLETRADLPAAGLWRDTSPRARAEPQSPAVSVVIPCQDEGEFLVEAVASVERSILSGCELIIVNDGSKEPRALSILEMLRNAGYRVLDQAQAGIARACNNGFAHARASAVLPLDVDHRLLPGFVEPALELLQTAPRIGAVYGDRLEFGLRSGEMPVGTWDVDRLACGNYIDACALIRKRMWDDIGGYDENMPTPGLEDWDLWLGAAESDWELRWLPGPAFEYRVRPGSSFRRFEDPEVLAQTRGYILAKHQGLYFDRLRHLMVQSQEMTQASDNASRSLAEMQGERDALKSQLDLESRLSAELQGERDALNSRLDLLGEENRQLAQKLESLTTHAEALDRERDDLVAQHSHLAGQLTALGAERDDLIARHRELAGQLTALGAERDDLVAQQRELAGQLAALGAERRGLQVEIRMWQEHMAFVESTRAWRMRERVLRLRRALAHFTRREP